MDSIPWDSSPLNKPPFGEYLCHFFKNHQAFANLSGRCIHVTLGPPMVFFSNVHPGCVRTFLLGCERNGYLIFHMFEHPHFTTVCALKASLQLSIYCNCIAACLFNLVALVIKPCKMLTNVPNMLNSSNLLT